MKKILCILLMLILVLSLVACGGNETPDKEDETPSGDTGDTGGTGDNLPDEPIFPDWNPGEEVETPIIPI